MVKRGLTYREKRRNVLLLRRTTACRTSRFSYRKPTLDSNRARSVPRPQQAQRDDGTQVHRRIPSKDGKYTASHHQPQRQRLTEIYVMDTKTEGAPSRSHQVAKFTGAAWDGDGFYYSAYPTPEAGKEFSNANQNHLGILSQNRHSAERGYCGVQRPGSSVPSSTRPTRGRRIPADRVYQRVGGQGVGNELKVRKNGAWVTMQIQHRNSSNGVVDVINNKIYILTSYGAPKNRLMVATIWPTLQSKN